MRELFERRTEVVSRGPAMADDAVPPTRPATPANDSMVIKRRRVCITGIGSLLNLYILCLQLAFDEPRWFRVSSRRLRPEGPALNEAARSCCGRLLSRVCASPC